MNSFPCETQMNSSEFILFSLILRLSINTSFFLPCLTFIMLNKLLGFINSVFLSLSQYFTTFGFFSLKIINGILLQVSQ